MSGCGSGEQFVRESRMVETVGPGGELRRADPECPWYEEVTSPGGDEWWRRYGRVWDKWKWYSPGFGAWAGPADPPVFPELPRQLEMDL